jgi:hypothetical protein
MTRLNDKYRKDVVPQLMTEQSYGNVNQVPRLEKVVLNMGLGEAIQNAKIMDSAVAELTAITGQKPVVTKSRKAIANFKLRENMAIGCMVTLRGQRMYEFLDRLMNLALPRVRDFRGVSDAPSTVVATTRSAFVNRSSFPKSTSTRSTRCAADRFHRHHREDRCRGQGAPAGVGHALPA